MQPKKNTNKPIKSIKKKINYNKRKIKKNTNNIASIDRRLSKIQVSRKSMFRPAMRNELNSEPSYLEGLLLPEASIGVKLPGSPDSTIAFHRHVTITAAANALGALGVLWQPTSLNDSTTNTSTLFINNSVGYDGISALGVNALGVATNFNLTAGAAIGYRLVSASIHLKTNASVLNSSGKINFALTPFKGVSPQATGTTLAAATGVTDNFLFIPTFENLKYSNVASIEKGQSARLLWYPASPLHKQMVEPNSNYQTGNTGAVYEESALCLVATGLAASQAMTIDIFANYELRPNTNSLLQGMETMCTHPHNADLVVRQLLNQHGGDVAFAYNSDASFSGIGYRANNRMQYAKNEAIGLAERIRGGRNR